MVRVIEVSLPEYNIKKKPNYLKLGKKVDKVIEKNFPDGRYILRALGSSDHKIPLKKLIEIILKTGTDKYDPRKKEVCHKMFCEYDHNMHASSFKIKNGKLDVSGNEYPTIFGDTVYHFYEHTPFDRGYAIRLDLLLIYDAKKIVRAKKKKSGGKRCRKKLSECLYKFKDPKNKKDALLGIVVIKK